MVAPSVFVGDTYNSNKYGEFVVIEYISWNKVKVQFKNTMSTRWTTSVRIRGGNVSDLTRKLVFGIGINDASYSISITETVGYINGKQKQRVIWSCPYYVKWTDMLKRCYSDKYKQKYVTYKDCIVCKEWFYFSNFIRWVDSQPNRDWMS